MVNLDKQRDAIGLDLTGEYYGSERRCSITRRPKQAWKERKTVTIDRISQSGNPIVETKHHGKHVHVPGANPGETVEVLIEEDHGNFFKGFMVGPNGISTREAKKKRERKERQEKRKQAKKKRKQELKNWEKRKEDRKKESEPSLQAIANRTDPCRSPQNSDANEDRVTGGSAKSDREKEIREEVATKYD